MGCGVGAKEVPPFVGSCVLAGNDGFMVGNGSSAEGISVTGDGATGFVKLSGIAVGFTES